MTQVTKLAERAAQIAAEARARLNAPATLAHAREYDPVMFDFFADVRARMGVAWFELKEGSTVVYRSADVRDRRHERYVQASPRFVYPAKVKRA